MLTSPFFVIISPFVGSSYEREQVSHTEWWASMKKSTTKTTTRTRQGIALCCLLASLLFLPGCGVYSKVPPVNPDEAPVWSGPLLGDADMENVRIYIKAKQRTITLNLDDLDGDLRFLLAEYDESRGEDDDAAAFVVEELSVNIPQNGNYVLVIEKTNR